MLEQYANQQPVNGLNEYELERLTDWLDDGAKKPPITAFTSGSLRTIADKIQYLLSNMAQQPVNDGWRVYNTGVDITDQCTFEDGIITLPEPPKK